MYLIKTCAKFWADQHVTFRFMIQPPVRKVFKFKLGLFKITTHYLLVQQYQRWYQ